MGDQIFMGTTLDDLAVVQHHDTIGVHNGRQPVSNNEYGSAVHQLIHTILHQFFSSGVDGGGSFVQDHHGRIGYRCTGDGDQLPLALRKACAVVGQLCLVAFRQAGDEIVRIGQFCGCDAFFIGGIQLAVADVIHHRSGE